MEKPVDNTNPLKSFYRQPQIYIKLPSEGRWYDESVIESSTNGEYPVYSMTSTDEMKFKIPDALMNGQATVDVVQSCMPAIKDAWKLINYDIDTILIAIRIATYGESMDVTAGVPGTNIEKNHSIGLPALLDQIRSNKLSDEVQLDSGLKVKASPLTYKQMTDAQLKTFEQQRVYTQVTESQLSVEEKTKRFTDSFHQLRALNTELLINNISEITMPDGNRVTDKNHIKEFIDNADAKLIKDLEEKLSEIRSQGSIKPFTVKATEEHIKAGAPVTYQVPITFDNANFFV